MLYTQPQSFTKIVLDSFTAYKKLFLSVLPMALISVVLHLVVAKLQNGEVLNLQQLSEKGVQYGIVLMIMEILILLNFCWGIRFVYERMQQGGDNYVGYYKTSLQNALSKFFQIMFLAILFVVSITAIIIMSGTIISSSKYLNNANVWALRILLAIGVGLLVLVMLGFSSFGITYLLEILTKKTKVFSAVATAARVTFRFESLLRSAGFFSLILLVNLIIALPFAFLFRLINLSLEIKTMLGLVVGTVISGVIYPYLLIIIVNWYSDLMLRSEKPASF